jgi:hypothetical protein
MLGSKMRVLFAIRASRPVLQSRAFTTTPIHHKEFMDPFASFSPSDTPELVTPEGLRSINKYTAAQPKILSAPLQPSSEEPPTAHGALKWPQPWRSSGASNASRSCVQGFQ